MVVVSHLFFFLRKYFRGRCDSGESHRPLSGTIYFPTAPFASDPGDKEAVDIGAFRRGYADRRPRLYGAADK